MAKEIKTHIQIEASAEKVWQVLTNFENYSNWNPFITSIKGEKVVGSNLSAEITPPNRKMMTFKPVVLKYDVNKELRWLGSAAIKGFFDGEHSFKIVEQEKGIVTFVHGEVFTGILVGLMPKMLVDTKLGFEQMNKAIKKECETNT
ncbi:MAG: hypothetical protein ACI9JN_000518 [Bacteroidia bacterium]|jgi:hypothetical protein